MVSHVQSHKRPPERAPGVLHPSSLVTLPERQALDRSEQRRRDARWRAVSAAVFLMFAVILVLIFTSDLFYVRSIQVHGNDFLTREEIFAFSDIADYHIFWLDSAWVSANILRSASIADAALEISWPPNLVTVRVTERQPAIVWTEAGAETWVDLQGRVMPARSELPDLLRIEVVSEAFDEPPAASLPAVNSDLVLGALQLGELLPAGTHLDYHPIYGLGWTNHSGWQVWMGSGGGMREKIRIYEFLGAHFAAQGIEPAELSIANPDAPFYRVLWGR